MNTFDPFLLLAVALVIVSVTRTKRSDRYISLPSHKFWSVVRSQEKHIVLLTTRGYLIKRLCYVFPYQGILFTTPAKMTEAPDGVTLIGTEDSFSVP